MKKVKLLILSISSLLLTGCAVNAPLTYQGTLDQKWITEVHRYDTKNQAYVADTTYLVRTANGKFVVEKHYWKLLTEGDSLFVPTVKNLSK